MVNPVEVVERYQQATARGDFKTARTLVHDDLSFHGPFDRFNRPEPLFAALQMLRTIVERADVKKVFVDGSDVCVLYDLVTNTVGTELIAEWYKVKDNKISHIRALFDARPFAPMFANREKAQRAG